MPKCSPGESARGGRGEGGRKGWGGGSAVTWRSPDRGESVVHTEISRPFGIFFDDFARNS